MAEQLTQRQNKILKVIIDEYITNATPISSKEICKSHLADISSATVRIEMGILEKYGYIEKTHTSSGRIPTNLGYQYYQENIIHPSLSNELKFRLKQIFAQRTVSIETIINESVSIINETLQLPAIVTTKDSNETLQRIDLIHIKNNLAIVLMVTSSGNILKNTISFKKINIMNDLAVCIKIFNDRIVGTPLSQLEERIKTITPIIKEQVQNYEFIMQEIIQKVFHMQLAHTKVSGAKYLIDQPEFRHQPEKLQEVLNILDNTSVWEQISYLQMNSKKTTLIIPGSDFGVNELVIASAAVKNKITNHQISIVGPTRMNYAKIEALLDFITKELEKKYED